MYVADAGNNKIRKITPSGLVSTFVGTSISGSTDGQGTAASFNFPSGIAIDISGNLYVADAANNKIRKITPSGLVSTFAGSGMSGSIDGQGIAASFNGPMALTIDASGNLFVSDCGNNEIRKITPSGLVSTLAGSTSPGNSDGQAGAAGFYLTTGAPPNNNFPSVIAVDAAGTVYVADQLNNEIRKITPSGLVSTFAGKRYQGSTDGQGSAASFISPTGIALDIAGNIYVADFYNNEIRKITSGGLVSTFAGSTTSRSTDGQGSAASLYSPQGVAVDASGNIYVADSNNQKIRKITPNGLVSTLAGSGKYGSDDGQGAVASFSFPTDVAVDGFGNVYVAGNGDNKIRKITPTGLVSTFAGSGVQGNNDGQSAAASFISPWGLDIDASGNIYVADKFNNKIRKITPNGLVTTLAGSGTSGSADGQGAAASFSFPTDVAVDATGNIYVADWSNSTIRKISSGGLVSTFAGSGVTGNKDGQDVFARFSSPSSVCVDALGNVYVADQTSHEIRKISPSGLVSTLAGSYNTEGKSIDGEGSISGFFSPQGITIDALGNIYVADTQNNEIRKITISGSTTATISETKTSSITIFPNPAKDVLNITLSDEVIGTASLSDVRGSLVLTQAVIGKQLKLSTASLQNGIYVLTVFSDNASYVTRVVIAK